MRFAILALIWFESVFLAGSVGAQNPPAAPAIVRTVVAATKLAGIGTSPLYFRALAVTIPLGETSRVSAPDGILYQLSGSTEISAAGQSSTIGPGEAAFIAGGSASSLKAASMRPVEYAPFPPRPRGGARPARRGGTRRCQGTLPHAGTNPQSEARRLRAQPDPRNVSAADAVKPAPSPLGRGALLHPLRYRRQYGRGSDDGAGTRLSNLRALWPRPPMGQPRQ
jgi:hypothetical protein